MTGGDKLFGRPVEGECGVRCVLQADRGGRGCRHVRAEVLVDDVRYLLDRGVRPGRTGVPLVHEVVGVHLLTRKR